MQICNVAGDAPPKKPCVCSQFWININARCGFRCSRSGTSHSDARTIGTLMTSASAGSITGLRGWRVLCVDHAPPSRRPAHGPTPMPAPFPFPFRNPGPHPPFAFRCSGAGTPILTFFTDIWIWTHESAPGRVKPRLQPSAIPISASHPNQPSNPCLLRFIHPTQEPVRT